MSCVPRWQSNDERAVRRCPLPRVGAMVLALAALVACAATHPPSASKLPAPVSSARTGGQSGAASSRVASSAAPPKGPEREFERQLKSCWCKKPGSECDQTFRYWAELCAQQPADALCEPRQRNVLPLPEPGAQQDFAARACAALTKSGEPAQRWGGVRSSPEGLIVFVADDEAAQRRALTRLDDTLRHMTLTTCGARLVSTLQASGCDRLPEVLELLKKDDPGLALQVECLEPIYLDQVFVAAQQGFLVPGDANRLLRDECDRAPSKPHCPRPRDLDCSQVD